MTTIVFTILFVLAALICWRIAAILAKKETANQGRYTGDDFESKHARWIARTAFAIGVAIFVLSMPTVIAPGQVGVQVTFGHVHQTSLNAGLHLVAPWVDIKKMSVRVDEYTMSTAQEHKGGSNPEDNDAIVSMSKENLPMSVDVTVLYRLLPQFAPRNYKEYGDEGECVEKLIRPAIRTMIREVCSEHEAMELMAQGRATAQQSMFVRLQKQFGSWGYVCENVMLRRVDPTSEQVLNAIADKLKSQQDAEAMQFVLAKAKSEAERKVVEAKGIADSQNVINRTLTAEYLQWYYIETLKALCNSPNHSTVILPFDQKLTPLLSLPAPKEK